MAAAFEQASQAEKHGEVPIGAVVVFKNQIVGSGFNKPIATNDPTAHAEILALRDAARTLKNYRLPDTTLYTTLEPCLMCAGAIVHARVHRLVFAATDLKNGAAGSVHNLLVPGLHTNHLKSCEGGLQAQLSSDLIRNFFSSRRRKIDKLN